MKRIMIPKKKNRILYLTAKSEEKEAQKNLKGALSFHIGLTCHKTQLLRSISPPPVEGYLKTF